MRDSRSKMSSNSTRPFWIAILLSLFLIPSACYVHKRIRHALNQRMVKAARLQYSEALRPGSSRVHVESYLKSKGVRYSTRWPGADVHSKAFAILVKVADDDVPWYCSAWPEYVTFEFVPTERIPIGTFQSLAESDALTSVLQTSNGEGCL